MADQERIQSAYEAAVTNFIEHREEKALYSVSKVGKEIMTLLLNLNKERGTTLIIITHDPTIGAQLLVVAPTWTISLGSTN